MLTENRNPALGAVGRSLPHSLEAEEYLLSCCLLDGAEVISRCLEARIKPESFYDTKHGIVYESLLDLYKRHAPIDVAILAEELKAARLLDQIGGYAFLTQVSSRIPTTAQAGYFIEKVREQALLREIIHSATGAVEDCYRFTGGIDEFVEGLKGRLSPVFDPSASGSSSALLARAIAAEVDPANPPPADRPVFYIGEKLASTSSNITALSGRAKTAKTTVIGAMTSACLVADGLGAGDDIDTLGIRSSPPRGRAVVVIDTEQSPAHSAENVRRSLARAGLSPDQKPSWFRVYPIAGWSARDLTAVLPALLKAASKAHGGIHAVFLDGGADFTLDVNSSDEASTLCATWHALAIEHACAFVVIIHSNESRQSDDIARGWLGKQLRRKSESNLTLRRDGDVIVLYGEDGQRHAPILERDGPRFKWDDAAGMHRSCESVGVERDNAQAAELRELAEEVIGTGRLRYADLIAGIETARRIASKTAEKRFSAMKKSGVITKDLLGFWSMPQSTRQAA